MICTLRGTGDGHLYVLRGDEVTLAASCGGTQASGPLLDQIREYIDRARSEEDQATVVDSTEVPALAPLTATAEEHGRTYRLVPLTAAGPRGPRVVGVAAIAHTPEPLSVVAAARILEAIATKLEMAYEADESSSLA